MKLDNQLIRCIEFTILVGLSMTLNNVSAKTDTYYSCQNGFQFESKKDAARCIKQETRRFRSPIGCSNDRIKHKGYVLNVGRKGKQDKCVLKKSISINKPALQAKEFSPLCPKDYKLKIKLGNDSCATSTPEFIQAPSKKVKR